VVEAWSFLGLGFGGVIEAGPRIGGLGLGSFLEFLIFGVGWNDHLRHYFFQLRIKLDDEMVLRLERISSSGFF
jgi:hypothetical protein